MAETQERDGKTEDPTEHRLKTAIEKGNTAHSREVGIFAPLLASLIVIAALSQGTMISLVRVLAAFIENPGGLSLEGSAHAVLLDVLLKAALLVVPVIFVLMTFGVLSSVIQNQPRFVAERIRPQWNRISLTSGAKRLFGVRSLVEFGKSLAKIVILVIIAYHFIAQERDRVILALQLEPVAIPHALLNLSFKLVALVLLTSAVLSALDWAWVRFSWKRDLRMTRQEVKDEHKQMDGDPIVKSRLRALARDRARRRMLAKVPLATMVIANPTHFAVALRYKKSEGGAPLVVAKGQDLIALKIREIAAKNDIPIIEDKPLARSLYESVEVDRMIPQEFYRAIAKIILFLTSRGKLIE